MWKNIVEPGRPQVTICRMGIVCWIPKTANTRSEYVLLLAFQRQESLHERASVFVTRTLPVLFEIAVVYPTSPLKPHFPSTDPLTWTELGTVFLSAGYGTPVLHFRPNRKADC